jgi:hypothetical protein
MKQGCRGSVVNNRLKRSMKAAMMVNLIWNIFGQHAPYLPAVFHAIVHWLEVLHLVDWLTHAKDATIVLFLIGLLTSWQFILGTVVGAVAVLIYLLRKDNDDDDSAGTAGGPPDNDPTMGKVLQFAPPADADGQRDRKRAA